MVFTYYVCRERSKKSEEKKKEIGVRAKEKYNEKNRFVTRDFDARDWGGGDRWNTREKNNSDRHGAYTFVRYDDADRTAVAVTTVAAAAAVSRY